jgi:hypothetical protein
VSTASKLLCQIVAGGVTAGEFHVADVDEVVMAISSLCVDICRWFPSRKHVFEGQLRRHVPD